MCHTAVPTVANASKLPHSPALFGLGCQELLTLEWQRCVKWCAKICGIRITFKGCSVASIKFGWAVEMVHPYSIWSCLACLCSVTKKFYWPLKGILSNFRWMGEQVLMTGWGRFQYSPEPVEKYLPLPLCNDSPGQAFEMKMVLENIFINNEVESEQSATLPVQWRLISATGGRCK